MSKRVPIRVPESKLNDWDEHADNHTSEGTETPKYDSRSQFIKYAVDEQIKRDTGAAGGTPAQTAQTGASTEQMDRIAETVERMANRVEDLEDRVEDATRAMQAGGSVDEETTTAVWAALPTAPERATTAEGVAEGLDVDPDTARVALESLHANQPESVRKREIEQIEEGDGTVTVTDARGRTLEIEDPGTAVRRRNPLWWRRE